MISDYRSDIGSKGGVQLLQSNGKERCGKKFVRKYVGCPESKNTNAMKF